MPPICDCFKRLATFIQTWEPTDTPDGSRPDSKRFKLTAPPANRDAKPLNPEPSNPELGFPANKNIHLQNGLTLFEISVQMIAQIF